MDDPDLSLLTEHHLHQLRPREQKILSLRYGLEGRPYTLKEIGEYFDVSAGRIQKLEQAAWRKLLALPAHGLLFPPDKVRPFEPTTDALEVERSEALARWMSVNAVRNTVLENYHAGKSPKGKRADYSDVTVVSPAREVPWNEVSRISDKEMRTLMLQVEKKLATCLRAIEEFRRRGTLGALVADLKEEYEQFGVTWDIPKDRWKEHQAIARSIRQRNKGKQAP
jgi:hypothetical protein